MDRYTPDMPFVTPPQYRGQAVQKAYSCCAEINLILERITDASDGSIEYMCYSFPNDDDGDWQPWNYPPRLGLRLGPCEVNELTSQ